MHHFYVQKNVNKKFLINRIQNLFLKLIIKKNQTIKYHQKSIPFKNISINNFKKHHFKITLKKVSLIIKIKIELKKSRKISMTRLFCSLS
jgi:hypothetical protein